MAKAPKSFAQVARGYANLWKKTELVKRTQAIQIADRIVKNLSAYTPITQATGVPEWAIGILHYRESNLNFGTYLGNGQTLSRKTTIVPKGRGPFLGKGAFTRGAIDALEMMNFHKIKDWTAARFLYESERFNGFGYFMRGINSPYVWGGTNHQQRGKFVRDGVFDPTVMDTQLGSAAILKALCELSLEINAQVNPKATEVELKTSKDVHDAIQSGKTGAQIAEDRKMTETTKVEVDEKSPASSKIVWTQVIGVAASVAVLFGFNITPENQAMIVTGITFAQGAITALLRMFGKQTAVTTGST